MWSSHSDDILSAIDAINKSLPAEQRIEVNAALSDSQPFIEDYEAKQKDFEDAKTNGGDVRSAHRALLESMERVQPFFDMGLSVRTPAAVVPSLTATKVNTVDGSLINIWAQDFGEYGYTPTGEAVFVRTGLGSETPNEDLQGFYQAKILQASQNDLSGNYGGNIEALPNGLLLMGVGATDDLKKAMEANRNYTGKILYLQDKLLEAHHIDEQISIVPTSDACGFGIVKADPVRGKTLAKTIVDSGEAFLGPDALAQTAFFRWTYNLMDASMTEDDTLQKAAAIIDANVARIVSESAKINPACKSMKVASVALPLHSCQINEEGLPEGCVSPAANAVNALILGAHAITSDPFHATLRKDVEDAFGALGSKVHFVNSVAMKAFGGGVHCGTNVKRAPRAPSKASLVIENGEAKTKVATWMKRSTESAANLPDSEKCALPAGQVLGYSAIAAEGAHVRIQLKFADAACPGFDGEVYLFADHFEFKKK